MRTMMQRFAALAMALALVFGSMGMVSAQTSDSETVTVTATVGGYIAVGIENLNVNLGVLDSFGLGQYLDSTVCFDAFTDEGESGAIYRAKAATVVTVTSDRSYNLELTASDPSGLFLVFDGDQGCDSPYYSFAESDGQEYLGLPATLAVGSQQTVHFGAQIPVGQADGSFSSTFTGLYTANAI